MYYQCLTLCGRVQVERPLIGLLIQYPSQEIPAGKHCDLHTGFPLVLWDRASDFPPKSRDPGTCSAFYLFYLFYVLVDISFHWRKKNTAPQLKTTGLVPRAWDLEGSLVFVSLGK